MHHQQHHYHYSYSSRSYHSKLVVLCSILLVFFADSINASSAASAFNAELYSKSKLIEPLDFTVYWRLDFPNNLIYIALKAKTTGWVGFGISEVTSGSMPGADILEGQVVDGVGTITDRYATGFSTPKIDDCQDWVLINAEEADGYTILEVKRPINSTDPQDRSIVYGSNMIIAAHGANDKDKFGFHHDARTTSEIIFFGEPAFDTTPPSDERTIALRMSNYKIPNQVTTYACQAFAVPIDQEYHIVEIQPVVNETNIGHVHHFLVHTCVNTYENPMPEPGECGDMSMDCSGLLSAWASGGGSTYTPPEAGFRMGPNAQSIKYIILQVHYDVPSGIGGFADNSGIILHYTPTLRKYDAGVMMIGDIQLSFSPIPPLSITHYESECISDCTKLLTSDIQVFSSFPHMHQVGTQIWMSQWRNGVKIAEHGRIEYWVFDHQTTQNVNFVVKPGDHLNLNCIYDTRKVNVTTEFGLASNEEMCLGFFSYYPRIMIAEGNDTHDFAYCGNLYDGTSGCGMRTQFNVPNPQHPDPLGSEVRLFGQSAACSEPANTASEPKSPKLIIFLTAAICGTALLVGAAVVGYRKFKKLQHPLDHMQLQLVPQTDSELGEI